MLDDMFLWLVANLKQGVIYFIKQALPPNISAGSVYWLKNNQKVSNKSNIHEILYLRELLPCAIYSSK